MGFVGQALVRVEEVLGHAHVVGHLSDIADARGIFGHLQKCRIGHSNLRAFDPAGQHGLYMQHRDGLQLRVGEAAS